MNQPACPDLKPSMSLFKRYLTVWVGLCMAGKSTKPVFLTLFINWAVKPFTMYGIAVLFLGGILNEFIGGFLLGVGKLPVPWEALLLSIAIYVALPLVCGYASRKLILRAKGEVWFKEKFLHVLTPITITALLLTLVLLFSFKGAVPILANPLTILWIAIPLTILTILIFMITYFLAKVLGFSYRDAAPSALIGGANHFEVAIATRR